jgi:uncharacterized protein (TIGR03435 family)
MKQALVIAGLAALVTGITFGQAGPSQSTFEVASVKLNTSLSPPSMDARNGRVTMYNYPMKLIVARAYQVANDRVTGPDWVSDQGYDIVAKYGPDTTRESLWAMLQNLLAERFKLEIHHEQKPAPVWALVVGKNGPKFKGAAADSPPKFTCSHEGAQNICENHKSTMAELTRNLPRWVRADFFGMPIVDLTGLTGVYDFTLTWTWTDRPLSATEASDPGIDLFRALQDQLGLNLEQRKVPLDRIVIDHVERVPIEN